MSSTLIRPAGAQQPAATPPAASGRFAGLDGIRALAIISVFVFHLYPAWLPGGFLGVDVFFVISGFLITSLLIRERATKGRIDFKAFWTRRARRLLPALALCVGASALVARAVNADLVVGLPRQVLGAATFSTNWLEIGANASYFDQTAPTLFMNFWSLAVEEQFYLVWPLATFALLTYAAPRVRLWVPAVAAVASTALMAWLYVPGADATRVYYGTDTHLMGLMIGASLAFAWASGLQPRMAELAARGRRWSGPAALTVLLVLMLLLSEQSAFTFRGGFALASLVTGVLVIATVARHDGVGRPVGQTAWQRILDAPAASWVGERSYGLYLWHWPVILVVDQLMPTTPNTPAFGLRTLVILLVAGAIAEASYRFVETPVRVFGFRETGRRVLAWLRGASPRRAQSATAAALAAGLCLIATIATAPAQSATATVLEQNAAAAQAGAAQTGPAAGVPGQSAPGQVQPGAPAPSGAAGAASGTTASAPISWTMPTGAEIDGFGDSMMVGCVPALNLYFPGIRLDALSNRHLSDGIAAMKARGGDMRRAVVLDFGMNAGVDAAELGQALDLIGPNRLVVVVNLYGTFARVDADNAAIKTAVAGRENVTLADWNATVQANPGVLQADKKHPSLRGSHLYAQAIQTAFADLVQRHGGPKPELKTYPLPK